MFLKTVGHIGGGGEVNLFRLEADHRYDGVVYPVGTTWLRWGGDGPNYGHGPNYLPTADGLESFARGAGYKLAGKPNYQHGFVVVELALV